MLKTNSHYTAEEIIRIIDVASAKGMTQVEFPGFKGAFALPQNRPVQTPSQPPKSQAEDIGSFVTTFGKHTGRTLREMGPEKVRNYGEWLLENTDKKDLSEKAALWIDKADLYLRQG